MAELKTEAGLRVAVFSDSYRPYLSGVVRSLDTFLPHLRARGVETYLFAPRYPGAEEEEGLFRFFSLPAPRGGGFRIALPLSLRLVSTVRRLSPRIVHLHSPFLLGRAGRKVGRKLGIPVIMTYHTYYHFYSHYFPLLEKRSEELVLRYTLSFASSCDVVVAPSETLARFLRSHELRVPVWVIPTGIEPGEWRGGNPSWLRERGVAGSPVLLYVGRLALEKNLFLLLDVFRLIKPLFPEASLVLAGDGPLRSHLQSLAFRAGLSSSLHFLGRVEPGELRHVYASADLLVFPSTTETQGLVLLEAMAAGLPVVAARAGGAVDVVEDGRNGFLSPPEAGEMARRVSLLLSRPELRLSFATEGMKTAESFSASRQADRLLELYRELAAAAVPGRP